MSKDENSLVIIGCLGRSYGTKGWLRLTSYTQPQENIFDYFPWQVQLKGKWQPIEITQNREHCNAFIVHVEGYDTPEDVKIFAGANIAVNRHQLPKPKKDEYYWADLEGLEIKTTKGISLGVVDHLTQAGANDIIVVKGDRKRLIPFIRKQVVLDVDLEKKIITVDWDPDF